MAGPAPPSTMDSVIAATVEDMRKVLNLPAGWHASFSLRLNAESASVLVSFSKTEKLVTQEGQKQKMKKRSPSSRKRSAARGAEHRLRTQLPIVPPQQQPTLNPLSPPFVPYSASEPGQPVAGSVQDSGRKRSTTFRPESSESSPKNRAVTVSGPPPPPPRPCLGFVKEGGLWVNFGDQKFWDQVQRSINVNSEAVNAAIGRMSEGVGVVWDQAEAIAVLQALDSLTQCPGFGAKTWDDLVNSSRRGQIGAD